MFSVRALFREKEYFGIYDLFSGKHSFPVYIGFDYSEKTDTFRKQANII